MLVTYKAAARFSATADDSSQVCLSGASPRSSSHHNGRRRLRPNVLNRRCPIRAIKDEAASVPISGEVGADGASQLPKEYIDHQLSDIRKGLLSTADFGDDLEGACNLGLPDLYCSILPTPPPELSAVTEAFNRGKWLMGLLILQSTSSIVLDRYEVLLRDHLFVTLFLTMLVGAGGNAGNQSAIKIIRGLATGTLEPTFKCMLQSIKQQGLVALLLGGGLAIGGFARVWITTQDIVSASAITASLLMIVVVSIIVGTMLPYAFAGLKVDPAHGGTTIQVVMDVSGVAITCATCTLVLDQLAASLSR